MRYRSTIWETIQQNLSTNPEKIAVKEYLHESGSFHTLTSRQLLKGAEHIRSVVENHVWKSDITKQCPPVVALFSPSGACHIVFVLGVLAAGCAFLPLSQDWPCDYLKRRLLLDNVSLVLCQSSFPPKWKGIEAEIPDVLFERVQPWCDSLEGSALSDRHPSKAAQMLPQRSSELSSDTVDLPHCYILFTSGSTSEPRGVLGTELGIMNRIAWASGEGLVWPDATVAFSSPADFVDSMSQFLGSLLIGAVVLSHSNMLSMASDPVKIAEWLQAGNAEVVTALPRVWQSISRLTLSEQRKSPLLPDLRVAICSGEPLLLSCARAVRTQVVSAACRIVNLYGSTETAGDVTWFEVTDDWIVSDNHHVESVPVGTAMIKDTAVGIVTGDPPQICCRGEEGRIMVAGSVLAAGMLQDGGEGTNHPARKLPLCRVDKVDSKNRSLSSCAMEHLGRSLLLYDMGDVGSMDEHGWINIHGRNSQFAKISGVRVSLSEVEQTLRQHPHVEECVSWVDGALHAIVFVADLTDSGKRAAQNDELFQDALLRLASEKLPSKAVPRAMVVLPSDLIPFLPNGKLDRLQAVVLGKHHLDDRAGSVTMAESPKKKKQRKNQESYVPQSRISAVVRSVLEFATLEATQNFFLAGADSLAAAAIAQELGTTPETVLRHPSIRDLAQALSVSDSPENILQPEAAPELLAASELHSNGPLCWKAPMELCIDTSLVTHNQHVFACSHGGEVAAFRIVTGETMWRARFPPYRFDCGMVVLPRIAGPGEENGDDILVVAAAEGGILFLDCHNGQTIWEASIGVAIRAAPVADRFSRVWIGMHGDGGIAVLSVHGWQIQRLTVSVPISAPISFATMPCGQDLALAAALDGFIICCTCSGKSESILWQIKRNSTPVFVAPVVFEATNSQEYPSAVVALGFHVADGLTCCILKLEDGTCKCEAMAWPASVPLSGIYCAPCRLAGDALMIGDEHGHLVVLQHPCSNMIDRAAHHLGLWSELECCCRNEDPSDDRPYSWRAHVVMNLGRGSRITGLAARLHGKDGQSNMATQQVAVTLASGYLLLIESSESCQHGIQALWRVAAAIKLPAPCFSGPQWDSESGRLLIGCRDDTVYCISVPDAKT